MVAPCKSCVQALVILHLPRSMKAVYSHWKPLPAIRSALHLDPDQPTILIEGHNDLVWHLDVPVRRCLHIIPARPQLSHHVVFSPLADRPAEKIGIFPLLDPS
jgi:hypothetical protein